MTIPTPPDPATGGPTAGVGGVYRGPGGQLLYGDGREVHPVSLAPAPGPGDGTGGVPEATADTFAQLAKDIERWSIRDGSAQMDVFARRLRTLADAAERRAGELEREVARQNEQLLNIAREIGERLPLNVPHRSAVDAIRWFASRLADAERQHGKLKEMTLGIASERNALRRLKPALERLLDTIHWWREGGMTAEGCRQAEADAHAVLAADLTTTRSLTAMPDTTAADLVKAAAEKLLDAALKVIQDDPHQWSGRPCSSCRAVTAIYGKPFGCIARALRDDRRRQEEAGR